MKRFLNRSIFWIGWLLSPFTFWNDAFINIPISYFCANLFIRAFPADFLAALLAFYWLSNLVGIWIIFVSGREVLKERGRGRALLRLVLTMAVYSIVLLGIYAAGLLKPIHIDQVIKGQQI